MSHGEVAAVRKISDCMHAQDKSNGILTKTLSAESEPSIIFEVHEEEVIIDIMETYNKESWK